MKQVALWDRLVDGVPAIDPDHPTIPRAERAKLVRYLNAGAVVAATTDKMLDRLAGPDGEDVVPMNFRTDGTWTWNDEVTYYLQTYGYAPKEPFLTYVRSLKFRPPKVSTEELDAAIRDVFGPAPTSGIPATGR
ncbi:MAG: hypothetical protein ACR2MY_10820 [Candidatus Dormibacteria bacterium]